MKRSRPPVRRTPLRPAPPLGRKGRLKPSGETKRKARARYRAYLKSPEWQAKRKDCFERAANQCEVWWEPKAIGLKANLEGRGKRCWRMPDHAHHKTYARLYNELPEDLAACCRTCHRAIEQTYYPHRHGGGVPHRLSDVLNDALERLVEGVGDDE